MMETASDLGLMTPSPRPSPLRILSALERQPGAWIRTGPRSIEHAGLRVRLTLGIVSVRIPPVIPDADPVPIQAAPATRDRIAELLEDRLRRATGADLDPDDIVRRAGTQKTAREPSRAMRVAEGDIQMELKDKIKTAESGIRCPCLKSCGPSFRFRCS